MGKLYYKSMNIWPCGMDARNKRTIAGCILDTTTCYDEEFDVIVITQPANPIVAGNSKTARKRGDHAN
jgi:hypothetical protein